MPIEAAHQLQGNHNIDFIAEPLLNDPSSRYLDWFVTICFYAALHLIEVKLAQYGYHPSKHIVRNRLVQTVLNPKYPGVWDEYYLLEEKSRRARYDCVPISTTDAAEAMTRLSEIKRILSLPPC